MNFISVTVLKAITYFINAVPMPSMDSICVSKNSLMCTVNNRPAFPRNKVCFDLHVVEVELFVFNATVISKAINNQVPNKMLKIIFK